MTTDDISRLPGLTPADTRWLVAEAQRVLTDLGQTPTVVDGVCLALADGRTWGLANLALTISRMPRKRWPRAVRDQVAALAATRIDEPPEPAALRVKLWTEDRASELLTYAPIAPLPGLVAVLAAQGDRVSHEFGKLDLVGDREQAYDTALANVAALPRPRHTRRRVDPDVRSSWIEFLDSSDAYGAARVTVLPDLLRALRIDFPAHGVLVAVPTKYELWVHVPVDEHVLDTAVAMSWLAFQTFAEEPYPISPDVYWMSPDMHAVRVIAPDARGFDLDDQAMRRLLCTMGVDLGEAS